MNVKRLDDMKDGAIEASAVDPETDGKVWRVYDTGGTPDVRVSIGLVAKGTRTETHRHPETHFSTVIEGVGHLWLEGEMIIVKRGDAVTIPPDTLHAFGSSPEQEMWLHSCTTPPDPSKMTLDPSGEENAAKAFDDAGFPPR